ncbi:MAG: DUF3078 domain-containing protein [Rhodothermaceae bacterium]
MKKITFFLMILSFCFVNAQEQDSTLHRWMPSFVAGINMSQVSFKDWAKGGENSVAWTLKGNFTLNYKSENWRFKNQLKGEYGRTQIGDNDFRTTSNEVFLESVLSLNVGWGVDPYVSNMLRTQISTGYNYKVTPEVKISDFFDPGYITQSIGFTYDRHENFTTRLGLAFKETFTKDYRQYSDDNETKDKIEDFKFETGLESVTEAQLNLAENIDWKGKLRLFTRFENIDVWDVRWDNIIVAKVNSWLNVNFEFIMLYEKAQSLKTQMKEALQIGVTYKFL